jgi:hypothetical protein
MEDSEAVVHMKEFLMKELKMNEPDASLTAFSLVASLVSSVEILKKCTNRDLERLNLPVGAEIRLREYLQRTLSSNSILTVLVARN